MANRPTETDLDAVTGERETPASSPLQSVLGWLVIAGIAVMVISFCVVTFGQLMIEGWVGEQTEAWYLGVLAGGAVALASIVTLLILRGRRRP